MADIVHITYMSHDEAYIVDYPHHLVTQINSSPLFAASTHTDWDSQGRYIGNHPVTGMDALTTEKLANPADVAGTPAPGYSPLTPGS